MAVGDFQLTYGGVPFSLPEARVIRAASYGGHETEDPSQLPPRKHQPLTDLIEELDRLIPFQYLQDFAYPSVGDHQEYLARRQQSSTFPNPTIRIGDWFYPNGMSRWSVFRGLATSSQVREMLKITEGYKSAFFTMHAYPIGPGFIDAHKDPLVRDLWGATAEISDPYRLETPMFMLPPRPLAEHGGKFDGLYLVTLVDERFYYQFSTLSLKITKNTTWNNVFTQCALELGLGPATISLPDDRYSTGPEVDSPFWNDNGNTATFIDAIAHNLGDTIVRWLTIPPLPAAQLRYRFVHPVESRAFIRDNRGNATRLSRTAGGEIFLSGATKLPIGHWNNAGRDVSTEITRNSVVAEKVVVTFPMYITEDDPIPHQINLRNKNPRPSSWYEETYGGVYSLEVPIISGNQVFAGNEFTHRYLFPISGLVGVPGYSYTINTTAKALFSYERNLSGGADPALPLNISGMRSLAMQLAADYYNWHASEALDEVYPGTYYWIPEGYHDILWSWGSSRRQATTRIMHAPWNQNIPEMQHATVRMSGYHNQMAGIGGKTVAQAWRDSLSGYKVETTLKTALAIDGFQMSLNSIDNLPTEHRWKAKLCSGGVREETILCEGTSGFYAQPTDIVYRELDRSLAYAHPVGESVIWIFPDTVYNTNMVSLGKMSHCFPQYATSGGIQSVEIVPQTQTVYTHSNTARYLNGLPYFSGTVYTYRPTDGIMINKEQCWIRERNDAGLTANKFYDGQFAGFSIGAPGGSTSGAGVSPIYLVNQAVGGTVVGDDFSFVQVKWPYPDEDGYFSGHLQIKKIDGKLEGTNPPEYVWLRDANNVSKLWFDEIYECTKTGKYEKEGDIERDVYTTKDFDLELTETTLASGIAGEFFAPIMQVNLDPAWTWDWFHDVNARTLYVTRILNVSDDNGIDPPSYPNISHEVFHPYYTWGLAGNIVDGQVKISRKLIHRVGSVLETEHTLVPDVYEVIYAPIYTWKLSVDEYDDPRGKLSVTRLFVVETNATSPPVWFNNIWKQTFKEYWTWEITQGADGDGHVNIRRLLRVKKTGGTNYDDIKEIVFDPANNWEVEKPADGNVIVRRILDIFEGSVRKTQYTYQITFDQDDFRVEGANGAATVETEGYTGTIGPFYRYCCVNNQLRELVNPGFQVRHGLIKNPGLPNYPSCPTT